MFATNVDRHVVAGKDHPIEVRTDPASGEPAPYLLVRDSLWALIGRNVFYRLVDLAEAEGDGDQLWVRSGGERFSLGSI